ncbi:Rv1733c family protein [Amycolatopsis anabasis]|uniref:Rv1733c family protein n=1 Tax=Amycolatopsis anabasis TaxID=1840409 RepID=UPI00131B40D7|nr:hypothetical protein [Amycolatopsis anabasis]
MSRSHSAVARLWRRCVPCRNPLARRSDRLLGGLLILLTLLALAAVPFALALGSATYADGRRVADYEVATRHQTQATLLADAPPAGPGAHGSADKKTAPTRARWTVRDGSARIGDVPAESGMVAGTGLTIWLDEAGNPVDAPSTPTKAAVNGVSFGFLVWLGVLFGCAITYGIARGTANRAQYARWEREWARVERDWTRH